MTNLKLEDNLKMVSIKNTEFLVIDFIESYYKKLTDNITSAQENKNTEKND